MARTGGKLGVAHRPQFPPERLPAYRHARILPQPLHKVEEPPAHHAIKIRLRPGFDGPGESGALGLAEQRRLAIEETIGPTRVEAQHPVPHDLQAHPAGPGGHRSAAAVINRRQRQQAPGLCGVATCARKPAQIVSGIVTAKPNRCSHRNPPFSMVNHNSQRWGIQQMSLNQQTLVLAANAEPYRVDCDPGASIPIEEIERNINEAAVCFADITLDNPNVWFEVGFAIGSRKDLCLVCSRERRSKFPFDIAHRTIINYTSDAPRDFKILQLSITELVKAILKHQEVREDLQLITPLQKDDAAEELNIPCLVSIASLLNGIGEGDVVTNWAVKNEMEKVGYNRSATNIALRNLRLKGWIAVEIVQAESENYEAYRLTETGWDWLSINTKRLNLTVTNTSDYDHIPF